MSGSVSPGGLQYILFVAASPVVLIAVGIPLAVVRRNRKSNRSAPVLFHLLLTSAGWLVFNTLEQVASSEYWTLFFARLSYPFIVSLPVVWFLFARVYEGKTLTFRFRNTAPFFIIPLATCVMVFLPSLEHLVWRTVSFAMVGPFRVVRVDHGPWFWVHSVYLYCFLLYGAVLIFLESLKRQKLFKRQALWMILGVAVPLLVNFFYISRLIPGLVKDFTPLAFMFSGLAFTLGIFKFSLLDLIPIARSTVIEQMKDGIIILDPADRIIDMNNAAKEAIGCDTSLLGLPLDDLKDCWKDLAESAKKKDEPVRLKKEVAGAGRFYLVDYTAIATRSGVAGWVLELRDITEEIGLLKRIEHLAKTDELTGLHNRRNFADIAGNEITRSIRYGTSLAGVMLDLDHFKNINDTHGHQAGDRVLVETAELIRSSIRDFDVPARVGGEEFFIIMPETPENAAVRVAERIRKNFQDHRFQITDSGRAVKVTVSIGVASIEGDNKKDLDELIGEADKAMYHSKKTGRNRVTAFSSTV